MPSDNTKPLRVIQISDSHLFADASRELNGLNTFHSLQHVMKSVLGYKPDLVVFTGDIVDLAEAEAYLNVKSILENVAVPVFCIPGNHDDPQLLKQHLVSESVRVDDSVVLNHWQLFFLNSYIPNTHSGHLDKRQLQRLEQHLDKYPQHSALICLHHHPVPIGSRWMDAMGLDNAEELFDVIDRYIQVKGIIWGISIRNFNRSDTVSTCWDHHQPVFNLSHCPIHLTWMILLLDSDG